MKPQRFPVARRPRWLHRLLGATMLLAGAAVLACWLVPAGWVVDVALHRLGAAQRLDIRRSGTVAWRLRGGPLLEIGGLTIGDAQTGAELLRVGRILLALPWRTLRSGGAPRQLTRVELDSPQLNLPAVLHWLDSRPRDDSETTFPAITHGVSVVDGRVDGAGWSIQGITLNLPQLAADARANAAVSARYVDAANTIDGELALAMTRPAPGAGAAVVGALNWQREGIRVPLHITLSGALHPVGHALRITPLRLALNGELVRAEPEPPITFALALAGAADLGGAQFAITPLTLDLVGDPPLPALHATGTAVLGDTLHLAFNGELPRWPAAWPALPAPLDAQRAFGFTVDYDGAVDFSAALSLHLDQAQTRLDTRLHLPAMLAWLDAPAGSPLPPLQGRLTTPLLELSGIRLRGIEVELDQDAAPP